MSTAKSMATFYDLMGLSDLAIDPSEIENNCDDSERGCGDAGSNKFQEKLSNKEHTIPNAQKVSSPMKNGFFCKPDNDSSCNDNDVGERDFNGRSRGASRRGGHRNYADTRNSVNNDENNQFTNSKTDDGNSYVRSHNSSYQKSNYINQDNQNLSENRSAENNANVMSDMSRRGRGGQGGIVNGEARNYCNNNYNSRYNNEDGNASRNDQNYKQNSINQNENFEDGASSDTNQYNGNNRGRYRGQGQRGGVSRNNRHDPIGQDEPIVSSNGNLSENGYNKTYNNNSNQPRRNYNRENQDNNVPNNNREQMGNFRGGHDNPRDGGRGRNEGGGGGRYEGGGRERDDGSGRGRYEGGGRGRMNGSDKERINGDRERNDDGRERMDGGIRERNDDGGGRGGRGGMYGGGRMNGEESSNYNRDDDGPKKNDFRPRNERSSDEKPTDNPDAGDPTKPAPVTYIPPEIDESEAALFQHIAQGANFQKLCNYSVEVTGNEVPKNSLQKFEDAGVTPKIMENIKKSGYTHPTPIQQWSIPAILEGRDLMACAQTGSGKTAAFLVPVLSQLLTKNDCLMEASVSNLPSPLVLILAPTRELALQIHMEVRKFAFQTVIKSCCIYGGVSVRHHISLLVKGVHVVVGTAGRICDFTRTGKLDLSHVKYLILDEADRMLDMGFHDDVYFLVTKCGGLKSNDRQTLLYSATFPVAIQKLAYDILHDYVFVTVGMVGQANMDIEQTIWKVDKKEKKTKLKELLKQIGMEKVIVFVKTKLMADCFCIQFSEELDIPMTTIHGDLIQKEREYVIGLFREDKAKVLCATSVAARGLDIAGVNHVVNYDLPDDIDEYVHRIGRTARCGNVGKAWSFFTEPDDLNLARPLVKVLTDAQQKVPDWLEDVANDSLGKGRFNNDPFKTRDARRDGKFQDRQGDRGTTAPISQQPIVNVDDDTEWT